jgi:hypothetical protein
MINRKKAMIVRLALRRRIGKDYRYSIRQFIKRRGHV